MAEIYYGMTEIDTDIVNHYDNHTIARLIEDIKEDMAWVHNHFINCLGTDKQPNKENDLVRMEYFLDLKKNFDDKEIWEEVTTHLPLTNDYRNSKINLDEFHQYMGELIVKLSYAIAYDNLLKVELCESLGALVTDVKNLKKDLSEGKLKAIPEFFENNYNTIKQVAMLSAFDEDTVKRALLHHTREIGGCVASVEAKKEVFEFLDTFRKHDDGYFGTHCNSVDCALSCYEEEFLSDVYILGTIEDALDDCEYEQVHILRELDKSVLLKMSESRPLYIEDMDKYFQSEKLGLNLGNYIVPSFMTMCEELGKSNNPKYEALVRWCGDYGVYEPNAKGETIMDAYLEMKDIALVTIGAGGGFMRTTITALKGQEGREDNVKERVREYIIQDVMEDNENPLHFKPHFDEFVEDFYDERYNPNHWRFKDGKEDGKDNNYEEPEPEFY